MGQHFVNTGETVLGRVLGHPRVDHLDPSFSARIPGLGLEASLLALMPLLIEEEAEPRPPAVEDLLQEAREVWAALERYPLADRWKHIETAPPDACRSWPALARVISEAATAGGAEARELTELSLLAAAWGSEGASESWDLGEPACIINAY
ncbi:MAG TPA: hypothetical protein VF179_15435 [Thermoanaerobaculia bacterium]|nr:hypothetical protein [Thermoanaerobaculia bacterium]